MTINQTIDGVLVSRELLKRFYTHVYVRPALLDGDDLKLRALLDGPVCKICDGFCHVPDGEIYGSGGVEFENGPIECVKDCPACKPAAQPQGEPVAWVVFDNGFIDDHTVVGTVADEWADRGLEVTPLYAEQPAPVAVVLPVDPERERLMEIVQQYPNVDPLKYDAAVRTLRK